MKRPKWFDKKMYELEPELTRFHGFLKTVTLDGCWRAYLIGKQLRKKSATQNTTPATP